MRAEASLITNLCGMMSRGFLPNMFAMSAPGQQAVVTVNHTQPAPATSRA